jgi:hypothetical protein
MALAAGFWAVGAIIHHSPLRAIAAVLCAVSAVMFYVSARKARRS